MRIASHWTPRRVLVVLIGACCAALTLLHPGQGFAAAGDLRAVTLEADGAAQRPAVSNKGQTTFAADDRLARSDTNSSADAYEVAASGAVRHWSPGWGGAIADGASTDVDVAGGGGRVVFSSTSTNLWGSDNNGKRDVYVCKRGNGECQTAGWVKRGTEPNGDSYRPRISADGAWVVFASDASNWVAKDTNGVRDVFIANLKNGKVSRVSVGAGGEQLPLPSDHPQVSADGNLVTFSTKSAAVRRDTNQVNDVYLRDRGKGTTQIASLARNGSLADKPSVQSAVAKRCSGGTCRPTVAFVSRAGDLVPGDTNNARDVFIREGNSTGRASVSSDGREGKPKEAAWWPTLSADARYIAFATHADIAGPGSSVPQVMLRDRNTGKVTLRSALGGVPGDRISTQPSLSPNGQHLAFMSRATNLDTTDADNGTWDVFVSAVS